MARFTIKEPPKDEQLTLNKVFFVWLASSVVLPLVSGIVALTLGHFVSESALGLYAIRGWFLAAWTTMNTMTMLQKESKGWIDSDTNCMVLIKISIVATLTSCATMLAVHVAAGIGTGSPPQIALMLIILFIAALLGQLGMCTARSIGSQGFVVKARVVWANFILGAQLLASLSIGSNFGDWGTTERLLFCSTYPLLVLSFRIPTMILATPVDGTLRAEIKDQSIAMAAFCYRLVFFSLDSWTELISVLVVELTWKALVYVFQIKISWKGCFERCITRKMIARSESTPSRESTVNPVVEAHLHNYDMYGRDSANQKNVESNPEESETAFSFLIHQLEDAGDVVLFLGLLTFPSLSFVSHSIAIPRDHFMDHLLQTIAAMVLEFMLVFLLPRVVRTCDQTRHTFQLDRDVLLSLPAEVLTTTTATRVMTVAVALLWMVNPA